MIVALLLVPAVTSVALWLGADALASRCSPKWAARALVVLSMSVALATGSVLCVVAGLGIVQFGWAGRLGDWSADTVADRFPVPAALTVAVAVVAAVLVAMALAHGLRAIRNFTAAARSCKALGPGVSGLVVVDDDRVAAYAVPALRGRTVISRRLLRELDVDEARAVLAHESAHLRHRHFLYVQLAEIAAAANPLLRRSAAAVRRAVESWADDEAATVVGDRVCVARAVAKATLAYRGRIAPRPALAVGDASDVARRVHHLLDSARPRSGRWVALMIAAAAACAVSASAFSLYAHGLFEAAEALVAPGR
jgi:Zn-dependent protease with chaperone function